MEPLPVKPSGPVLFIRDELITNSISCYRSMISCFFLNQLVACVVPGICPFFPDYLMSWPVIVHDIFYFCKGCGSVPLSFLVLVI